MRNLSNMDIFYKEFKERVDRYQIESTPRKNIDNG